MCDIVLTTSESTDYEFSEAILIELLMFWCEVLTIVLGCMNLSGDVSGVQFARRRKGRECLPCHFLKVEKIALIVGKNALIVFIHGLNIIIMLSFKMLFQEYLGGKAAGRSFTCCGWNAYRNALMLRNFSYPAKFLVAYLRIVLTPDKRPDFSAMPTLYRVGSCSVSRTYPI